MLSCSKSSHILSSKPATSFGQNKSGIIFERMEKRKRAWAAELYIYMKRYIYIYDMKIYIYNMNIYIYFKVFNFIKSQIKAELQQN